MSRGRALGLGSLKKRGANWILDWTDASGNRHRQSLGPNKADAERRRLELVRRREMVRDGLGAISGMDSTLAEVVAVYLEDLGARVTPRHHKNVEGKLRFVVAALGETRIRDLRPMDVVRLRSQMTAAGRSHRTSNLYADNLRSALSWAVEAGIIASNPLQRLKRLPTTRDHQRCKRRALSEIEIACLLAAAEDDDERCELLADDVRIPTAPLFRAMIELGGRYTEMVRARWADVDMTRGQFVLRAENTKGRKQRVIPITAEQIERLKALKVLHEARFGFLPMAEDHVFLTPTGVPWPWHTANLMRIFHRVLALAGIDRRDGLGRKLDLHALRHTFGSRLARANVGLAKAQRLMGHSDPKLTAQVYTHLEAEDLRDAIEALPPIQPAKHGDAAALKEVAS